MSIARVVVASLCCGSSLTAMETGTVWGSHTLGFFQQSTVSQDFMKEKCTCAKQFKVVATPAVAMKGSTRPVQTLNLSPWWGSRVKLSAAAQGLSKISA